MKVEKVVVPDNFADGMIEVHRLFYIFVLHIKIIAAKDQILFLLLSCLDMIDQQSIKSKCNEQEHVSFDEIKHGDDPHNTYQSVSRGLLPSCSHLQVNHYVYYYKHQRCFLKFWIVYRTMRLAL